MYSSTLLRKMISKSYILGKCERKWFRVVSSIIHEFVIRCATLLDVSLSFAFTYGFIGR